jgi:hypothetical protein
VRCRIKSVGKIIMADIVDEALRDTGEVMQELVLKAGEARRAGRTRRDFFASTAKLAGATALGAAGAGLLQPIAARAATSAGNTDTAQDILDIAATAEALAVTFYYNGLQAGMALPDVNSTANQNYFQAAAIQENEHLLYLRKFGAAKPTHHFYFPTNMFTDESVFFQTALTLEAYFISAYLAAALDFSGAVSSNMTTANPTFLGFAVQVLGVECEHRALLGVAANVNPPNGIIIESALVKTVQDAGAALKPFLKGGDGYAGPVSLPAASEVNSAAQPYGFSFFPRFSID